MEEIQITTYKQAYRFKCFIDFILIVKSCFGSYGYWDRLHITAGVPARVWCTDRLDDVGKAGGVLTSQDPRKQDPRTPASWGHLNVFISGPH